MPFRFLLTAFALVALSACSSGPGAEPGDEVVVTGTVTGDASSSKTSPPIEGAAVTASAVTSAGSSAALPGRATTDANSAYSLTTEATADPVILSATFSGFESRALLEGGAAAGTSVTAPPMTAETDAEAGVFVLARRSSASASVADVAFFVTAQAAARLHSGETAHAEVAAIVNAASAAERAAVQNEGEDVPQSELRDQRRANYASYRAALAAAGSASARAAATAQFETDYAEAYGRAGLSSRVNARVGTARTRAVAKYSGGLSTSTRLTLRRRARVAAARVTTSAVEAAFEAEEASTSTMNSIRSSGRYLLAGLEDATTDSEMDGLEAAYATSVRHRLSSDMGVGGFQISGFARISAPARLALNLAVAAAASPEAVAAAVATYYDAVESAAQEAFGAEDAFAIQTFTLIGLHYSE